MSNAFYNFESGQPVPHSRGSSQAIRSEFTAIAQAFDAVQQALGTSSSLTEFRKIWLGARDLDPTQRYDGTALVDGDLYFNRGAKVLKSFSAGAWYAIPTSTSAMLKDGGTFTGPIAGPSADFSGQVKAASFSGQASGLTGFTAAQITNALTYTPLNKAGDTMTGTLGGTNVTLTGTLSAAVVQQTSDERLKYRWRKPEGDFVDQLAGVTKRGTFLWKRGRRVGLGVSAQQIAAFLPEAVHENDDGHYSLEYGPAALVAAIELAKEVVILRERIEVLEREAAQ